MSYYDARVRIDGDDSALQEKIRNANIQVDKVDQSLDRQAQKIHQIWSYGLHVTNLVISNLSRVAQTEEQSMQLRNIQQGLSIAQTEMSIAYTGYRAAEAFLEPGGIGIARGIALTSIAVLMQTLLIQQQMQKKEMENIAQRQKEVRKFFESYR